MLHAGIGKEALSDAARCTVLRPFWPKGYYRLGAAFMLLEVKRTNLLRPFFRDHGIDHLMVSTHRTMEKQL